MSCILSQTALMSEITEVRQMFYISLLAEYSSLFLLAGLTSTGKETSAMSRTSRRMLLFLATSTCGV